jgi:1-acyl-sn-glycerol-3-phosphate acyltransferase
MSRVRATTLLTGFVLGTLPCMAVQQAFLWTWNKASRKFPHLYHRSVLRWLGHRINVIGTPVSDKPCLIAANHVSWLDIPVLSALTPLSFIAKKEVAHWPGFGALARLQRSVFIDRDRRHSTGSSRDEIKERFEAGETIVLFAEGTSSGGVSVLPFKSAYFGAAEHPGVVIQPVTLAYRGHWGLPMNRRRRPSFAWYGDMEMEPHLWGAMLAGPIEVDIICHPPTSIEQAGSRKAAAKYAETMVRQGLEWALSRRMESPSSQSAANRIGTPATLELQTE